jgi:hypothetical protein
VHGGLRKSRKKPVRTADVTAKIQTEISKLPERSARNQRFGDFLYLHHQGRCEGSIVSHSYMSERVKSKSLYGCRSISQLVTLPSPFLISPEVSYLTAALTRITESPLTRQRVCLLSDVSETVHIDKLFTILCTYYLANLYANNILVMVREIMAMQCADRALSSLVTDTTYSAVRLFCQQVSSSSGVIFIKKKLT